MTKFLKSVIFFIILLTGLLYSQNSFVFAQSLPPTITFSGKLVDSSGTGISNAQVSLKNMNASEQVFTDTDGSFSFTVPTGTYDLTVNNRGGVTYSNAPNQFNNSKLNSHEGVNPGME